MGIEATLIGSVPFVVKTLGLPVHGPGGVVGANISRLLVRGTVEIEQKRLSFKFPRTWMH